MPDKYIDAELYFIIKDTGSIPATVKGILIEVQDDYIKIKTTQIFFNAVKEVIININDIACCCFVKRSEELIV